MLLFSVMVFQKCCVVFWRVFEKCCWCCCWLLCSFLEVFWEVILLFASLCCILEGFCEVLLVLEVVFFRGILRSDDVVSECCCWFGGFLRSSVLVVVELLSLIDVFVLFGGFWVVMLFLSDLLLLWRVFEKWLCCFWLLCYCFEKFLRSDVAVLEWYFIVLVSFWKVVCFFVEWFHTRQSVERRRLPGWRCLRVSHLHMTKLRGWLFLMLLSKYWFIYRLIIIFIEFEYWISGWN